MGEEFIIEEEIAKEETEAEKQPDTTTEPEASDKIEDLASELGWKPDGELNAKEFILKSRDIQDTMRGHIKEQKKQLTELGTSVEALKAHNEKVYKAEVNQLKSELESLKKEKREAVEEGDVDRVDELDEKIDGVKDAMSKPKPEDVNKPDGNPEFNAWVQENDWYKTDPEMAQYADAIADQNVGAPYQRVLALVTKKTKEMFPDKFEASSPGKTPSPSPVEGAGRKTTTPKFTKADLTDSQRQTMAQFVRQGIMTEKQYIADIAKMQ